MYIACKNRTNAIKKYFYFYFKGLKVGLVTGIQGSMFLKSGVGKSYTGLRLGEILDPSFSADKVVFTPSDFVEAMELIEGNKKPCQVILIDEAGILVNARKWFSLINKAVSDVVMTFRSLRCMAIFVTPDIMALDKYIRWFVSHLITTKKIVDKDHRTRVYARVYRLSWGTEGRKYYKKRLILYDRSQERLVTFKRFLVKLPDEELIKAYEDRVEPYKRSIRTDIEGMRTEERSYSYYVNDFLEKHRDKIHKSKGVDVVYKEELRDLYGIPYRRAKVIMRKILERLEDEGRERNI